jgi:hypothetical protein
MLPSVEARGGGEGGHVAAEPEYSTPQFTPECSSRIIGTHDVLSTGKRHGSTDPSSAIGAGGMGEVIVPETHL